jgi:hypothetical protein
MNATRFNTRRAVSWFMPMFAGVFVLVFATPADTAAQAPAGTYRISQRATVSQTLGNAVISLDYSRPLARDRADLFGKVVHWGELWTPGANEATVLEVSEEVKLNGQAVPEGRWSMWIIPSQVGPWELVLDARDSLFHTQRPELTDEQIRFVVDVEEGAAHVEAFTWAFPRIAQDGATMQMDWGTTRIPIEIEVEPNAPVLTVGADEAALYVGTWQVSFTPDPETGQGLPPTVLTVRHADTGSLHASFPPGAFAPPDGAAAEAPPEEDEDMTPQQRERAEARRVLAAQGTGEFGFVMVPRARGVFLLGWVQDGELLDVEEIYHEFEFDGDRAVRLTIRNAEDRVFLTATRELE